MVLLCNDMNSFSPVVFQFFFSDINIDMRLKMLYMCRFVMEHEFVSAEKYIVAVIQQFPEELMILESKKI